jgi:hypothetical protein
MTSLNLVPIQFVVKPKTTCPEDFSLVKTRIIVVQAALLQSSGKVTHRKPWPALVVLVHKQASWQSVHQRVNATIMLAQPRR